MVKPNDVVEYVQKEPEKQKRFARDGSWTDNALLMSHRSNEFIDSLVYMRKNSRATPHDIACWTAMPQHREFRPAFDPGILAVWFFCEDWQLWSTMPVARSSEAAIKYMGAQREGHEWAGGRYMPREEVIHSRVQNSDIVEMQANLVMAIGSFDVPRIAVDHVARCNAWYGFIDALDCLDPPVKSMRGDSPGLARKFWNVVIEVAKLISTGTIPRELAVSAIHDRIDQTEPRVRAWAKAVLVAPRWPGDPIPEPEVKGSPEPKDVAMVPRSGFEPAAAMDAGRAARIMEEF